MTKRWCIPPTADANFVAAMEDILDVYARPVDPARPLVCFDEAGKELQAHARPPLPPAPGLVAREDTHYVRHGSVRLFCAVAPHLGWRALSTASQRTGIEWAEAMRELVDVHFPTAERLVVVLDNLNIHRPAALYRTFPPAEAKRIWDKLELHYTPVHGSWLNLAELELSALQRQCLRRRLPDRATLEQEVAAWVGERNAASVRIQWRLTSAEARERLTHLYPTPEHAS